MLETWLTRTVCLKMMSGIAETFRNHYISYFKYVILRRNRLVHTYNVHIWYLHILNQCEDTLFKANTYLFTRMGEKCKKFLYANKSEILFDLGAEHCGHVHNLHDLFMFLKRMGPRILIFLRLRVPQFSLETLF